MKGKLSEHKNYYMDNLSGKQRVTQEKIGGGGQEKGTQKEQLKS